MSDVDLDRRLGALDAIDAPDLWNRVKSTTPRHSTPPPGGWGRGAAIGTAFVLSLASLAFVFFAFEGGDQPAELQQKNGLDASALVRSWSAQIPDAVAISAVVEDDQRIYVPTAEGAVVFPKECHDPCAPVWKADLLEGDPPVYASALDSDLAVGEGVVAITFKGRLAVFAAGCRTDGGVCEPSWRADPPRGANGYLGPVIAEGIVKVTSSVGEMPDHHVTAVAFETVCRQDGGICDPVWTGDLGVGTSYFPVVTTRGVFYQQVGDHLLGFAAHCRSDGGACEPALEVRALVSQATQAGALYGPVGMDGEVVITSGDGNLNAYPEHCGQTCSPLWIGPADDYLESFPVLGGSLVTVQTGSGVAAFPVACRIDGGVCEPRWTVALDSYSGIAYADERVVIAADHSGKGGSGIVALDTTCEGECAPLWSTQSEREVNGVASDGQTVFAGLRGEVVAYPVDCSDPCAPIWRASMPGETWWFLIDADRLIVATRYAGAGSVGLTLRAFEVPS
jgi:hypothetical protein